MEEKSSALKKIITLVFGLIVAISFISFSNPSFALADTNQNVQSSFEVPVMNEGETVSQKIISPSGEEGEIQVTLVDEYEEQGNIGTSEVPKIQALAIKWHTRPNVKNGTYNINVVMGATNAGFKVNISNKRITKAYDPWRFNLMGSTGNLTLDSSTQATYDMDFNMSVPWVNGPSWTGYVRAKIENGNLVTYAQ